MPALAHKKLLVVEDEYVLADDLTRALADAGAEVVGPFPDAAAALSWLDRGARVDGAVLDMNLGGEVSTAVARRLIDNNVPFVFATGYGHSAISEEFAAVPRWEKPYDAIELAAALPKTLFS